MARALAGGARTLTAVLAAMLLSCIRTGSEEGLVDAEYQYHRVGNRKATYAELQDMQKREELHIGQLQAEIELLQQRERELATEREAREASLRLLVKDVETAKREVDALKAEAEAAIAARTALELQVSNAQADRDQLEAQRNRLGARVEALRALLEKVDAATVPDRGRLLEALEGLEKELSDGASKRNGG